MKKEYMIQMRFDKAHNGEWVYARSAFGAVWCIHPYETELDAEKALERLIAHWEEKAEPYHKEKPIEYRFIYREVTEWKPV